MAKFVLFYDTARVPEPPASLDALLAWAEAHPGRFTYPAPPDFIGSTFLKHVLYAAVPDPARLQQPVDRRRVRRADRRRVGAARPGATASVARRRRPTRRPGQALHQLLDDGEVDFSMAFNPAEASSLILAGRLPDTVRSFVLRGRHHRQHAFRGDPIQRRPPGRGDRHGRVPAVAGGAGAQAGRRASGAIRPCSTSPHSRPRIGRASRRCDLGPATLPPDRLGTALAGAAPDLDGAARAALGRALRRLTPLNRLLRLAPPLTIALFLGPVACGLAGTVLPALAAGSPGCSLLAAAGPRAQRRCSPWAAASAPPCWRWPAAVADRGRGRRAADRRPDGGCCCPCCWRCRISPAPSAPLPAGAVRLAGAAALALAHRLAAAARPADGQRPLGLALTLGLALREVPVPAAGDRSRRRASSTTAPHRSRSPAPSGYGRSEAWLKLVLPVLYRQIRLPLYAVLAFALSVVDMALVLGPSTPPVLAVQAPALADRSRPRLASGRCRRRAAAARPDRARRWRSGAWARWRSPVWPDPGSSAGPSRASSAALAVAGRLADIARVRPGPRRPRGRWPLWSLAGRLALSGRLAAGVVAGELALGRPRACAAPIGTTLAVGVIAVAGGARGRARLPRARGPRRRRPETRVLALAYLPLLVPQIGFLFGLQVLFVRLGPGRDADRPGLVASRLRAALHRPDAARPLPRLRPALARRRPQRSAARRRELFWRVRLPLLRRPILVALAVGFSVSVAQYLPTLFIGAGRFPTLTTEALALAVGGDRRLAAVAALLLAALPLLALAAALAVPSPRLGHQRARLRPAPRAAGA